VSTWNCCQNDQCVSGTSDAHCGQYGETCDVCGAWEQCDFMSQSCKPWP
jgi:hypothetical protein